MAKRYTDSRKWDDSWFTDLSIKYKMFWVYMLDKCNHAGIYKVNLKLAEFLIDEEFDEQDLLKVFRGRVEKTPKGDWFIPKFVEFQYGDLENGNRCHKSVEVF